MPGSLCAIRARELQAEDADSRSAPGISAAPKRTRVANCDDVRWPKDVFPRNTRARDHGSAEPLRIGVFRGFWSP